MYLVFFLFVLLMQSLYVVKEALRNIKSTIWRTLCLGERFNSVFFAQRILADQLEVTRVTDEDWEDEEDYDEDEDAE